MQNNWYLVKVLPGKERQLTEQYNKEISLGKITNILRFVCPLEKNLVVVKNKKVTREKVLYSGYFYFEIKTIASQQSIMGILGDRIPVLLRESDVMRILKDEVLEEHLHSMNGNFTTGDTVKITEGPFVDFNGVVSANRGDKIEVEVKIFGRGTIVTVSPLHIERV
jgi:transcriptional antiterminator NusG